MEELMDRIRFMICVLTATGRICPKDSYFLLRVLLPNIKQEFRNRAPAFPQSEVLKRAGLPSAHKAHGRQL